MENRWKQWTSEEDDKILHNPETSNTLLASELHRTENAIRYRRAHLAAKMHLRFPNIKTEECASMLVADHAQVMDYLEQWKAKGVTFDRFLLNRKRGADDEREEEPPMRDPPRILKPRVGLMSMRQEVPDHSEGMIGSICQAIRDEEGQLSHLWNDPDMIPVLIRFYPGFRAYAEFIRGM
jgi:hypothetical protein